MSGGKRFSQLPLLGIVMPLAEQRGGAELALLHYLAGVDPAQRKRIHLCFLEDGPMIARAAALGCLCVLLHAGRLRQPLQLWRTVHGLHRWIRVNRLQVVLSWLAKAHLYAGPAAWFAGVPAIWWQHGLPTGFGIDGLATLLPARRILACSAAAASAQRALWRNRLSPQIIHPPVDLEACRHASEGALSRTALGLPEDAFVVGIVARLQRWKGVHLLFEALARLLPERPALRLLVIGGAHAQEPAYPAELAQLAARLGVAQQVHMAGQRDDVPACMRLMDVVVNASFGEPFGMVIVEAMALGKPVLAPRAKGPLEIISHDVDGLLFEPGSVDAIVAALRSLLDDPPRRAALGSAATARAAHFGLPRFAAELSDAVAEVAFP